MAIRVLVNGAYGKMGTLACEAIQADPDLTLAGKTGRDDNLQDALDQLKPEVALDLTNAESALANTQTIINAKVHPVIGTSGLLAKDILALKAECEASKLGGIIVPNFSIGAVLMMRYGQEVAKYLPNVEIIEAHHEAKLDSPSGTAMKTAALISKARRDQPYFNSNAKEIVAGARGAKVDEVPIHSLRLPGVIAQQSLIFGNTGETLTVTHNTLHRDAFMPGVCLACKKVTTFNELKEGLDQIL